MSWQGAELNELSSLSSLVRDESPPTAIKCESFSCSSSQPFTKSTVYLQQKHRGPSVHAHATGSACAHTQMIRSLMNTKLCRRRRDWGLNLKQRSNEQIWHTRWDLPSFVETEKQTNPQTEMSTDLLRSPLTWYWSEMQEEHPILSTSHRQQTHSRLSDKTLLRVWIGKVAFFDKSLCPLFLFF